jgi:hypothetical protein
MEVTHYFLADFKNFIVPIFRANYLNLGLANYLASPFL